LVAYHVTGELQGDDATDVMAQLFYPSLLLHDLILCDINFDPPLWSLPVEAHIYLFFPLLVWGWGRYGVLRATFVALLAAVAAMVLLHFNSTLVRLEGARSAVRASARAAVSIPHWFD